MSTPLPSTFFCTRPRYSEWKWQRNLPQPSETVVSLLLINRTVPCLSFPLLSWVGSQRGWVMAAFTAATPACTHAKERPLWFIPCCRKLLIREYVSLLNLEYCISEAEKEKFLWSKLSISSLNLSPFGWYMWTFFFSVSEGMKLCVYF